MCIRDRFSSIHDLNLASLYCDKIIFLYQGRIVDYGTPEEVLTRENIKTYFGIESQITKNEVTGKLQIYYLPGWVKDVYKRQPHKLRYPVLPLKPLSSALQALLLTYHHCILIQFFS